MILNQQQPRTVIHSRPHSQTSTHYLGHHLQQAAFYDASPYNADQGSADLDLDFDQDYNPQSLSSSPLSTQSQLSHYLGVHASPLSTFDSIPTITAPRGNNGASLFNFVQQQKGQSGLVDSSASLLANTDLMQTETWLSNGHLTPRSVGRVSRQRESSLSSLGSNGPASPYSHNTSNPQIAVTDSADGYPVHGLPNTDDLNYQLSKSFPAVSHDTIYPNFSNYASADTSPITNYPRLAAAPKRRNERRLLPPPDVPVGSNRSRPVSVASSIASDSPATLLGDFEDDRRQKNVVPIVPKLDRTMTDIYSDELYSPKFTITSTSTGQMPLSPSNDLFAQRVQAANQHLNANSPMSATSRGRSPFQQNSPLAPAPAHEFPSSMGSVFGSAHQMREQNKAAQDARALQQQMARSTDTGTPQTISPKDALLEFSDNGDNSNFPLFSQQNSNGFDADAMTKAVSQNQPAFDTMAMDTSSFNNYLNGNSQVSTGLQISQQYPFIAQLRQQSSMPSQSSGSMALSRMSSAETGAAESTDSPQRPSDTSADGGTYTCTYHGCTRRFDTPALLQKHKREGHRQAHGLNSARKPESAVSGSSSGSGMTSTLLNSQAGPHKCDRINPGTGKPCNTIFSRPYDLTRHEDTIHNIRKQKVRCDLCTDEKTFSRADALTRHYRVCHPDVEFPGAKRRRGGHVA